VFALKRDKKTGGTAENFMLRPVVMFCHIGRSLFFGSLAFWELSKPLVLTEGYISLDNFILKTAYIYKEEK